MSRGRPRKIVIAPPTELENVLATVLSEWCGIPGCLPQNHLNEVRELEEALEEMDYYIVKKRVD